MAAAPVTIDHTAFPYLIDMIVGYADMGALVALRTTSSAFRRRVDGILLKHVVITYKSPSVTVGTQPAMTPPNIAFKTPPGSLLTVGARHLPLAPQFVQVADIQYCPYRGETMSPAVADFKSVHTIRRSARMVSQRGTNYFKHATTVVDFFNMSQELYYRQSKTGKSIIYLPHKTKRYVLHVKWREDAQSYYFPDVDFKSVRNIKEWVLVFHPHQSCHVNPHAVIPFTLLATIAEITKVMVTNKAAAIIVGAESIHPVQLGKNDHDLPREASTNILRTHINIALTAHIVVNGGPAPPTINIKFLTYAEWLSSMDDATKNIEGVWPVDDSGYTCPVCKRVSASWVRIA